MKKSFLLIVLLLIVIVLTSCVKTTAVDYQQLLTDINTEFGVSDVKFIDKVSDLCKTYSINAEDVADYAAEEPDSSVGYTEIVLIEAVDADAADRIRVRLNNHLDMLKNMTGSYDAEFAAMVAPCHTVVSGNRVYLVVSEHSEAINDFIASKIL